MASSSTSTILGFSNNKKGEKRADTKQNLILSALVLFAERGIDAVSMRTINNAAGTKNASAVHYHFGNKLGIIEAVIDCIKAELDRYRLDAIATLERRVADGEQPTPREIMWAAFTPYAKLYTSSEHGRAAIRFLARLQTDMSTEEQALLHKDPHQITARIDALLAVALPELSDKVRQARYLMFWILVVQGFSGLSYLATTSFGDVRPDEQDGFMAFFDYIVGGMAGPSSS